MNEKINLKNKGNVLKVVELGLENRVFDEMKKSKFSVEKVTRELNDEGIKITAQSIRKFIKQSKVAQKKIIAQDLQAAEEFKKLTMDYGRELKSILVEVEEVKSEAKTTKDFATYNQMVDKLYKGIELIAKLTGDIKPNASVDINIIYNEINSNIETEMKNLKNEIFKNVVDIDSDIKEEDEKQKEILENG